MRGKPGQQQNIKLSSEEVSRDSLRVSQSYAALPQLMLGLGMRLAHLRQRKLARPLSARNRKAVMLAHLAGLNIVCR